MTVVTRELQAVLSVQSQQWNQQWSAALNSMKGFTTEIRAVQTAVAGVQTTLETGVAAPLKSLDNQMKAMNFGLLSNQLKSVAEVGGSAFAAMVAPATRFEAEMRNVNTIAKLGEADFRAYSNEIRTLGPSLGLGVGPAQAAGAAYNILSSNFRDAASAQQVLTVAMKAATAGMSDASDSSKAITGSLNAYHLGASEAARFSDILFTTVDRGVVTFPQLAQSIGQVAGIAAQSGISFEELNAAIATATVNGLEAPIAIEGLRNVIVHLLSPTKEGAKELEKLGIIVSQESLGQKGLAQTLIEINNAAGGQADILEKVVGGHRGLTAALALVGDGGQLLEDNLRAMNDALGATDSALKEQQKSLEVQVAAFKALGEAVLVSFGETALPALKSVVEGGTGLLKMFDSLPGPLKADTLLLVGFGTAALFAGAGLTGILALLPSVTAGFGIVATAAANFGVQLTATGAAAAASAAILVPAEAAKVSALGLSEVAFEEALAAEIAYGAGSAEAVAASALLDGAIVKQVASTKALTAAKREATAASAAAEAGWKRSVLALGLVTAAAVGAGLAIQALGAAINDYEEAEQKFTKDSATALVSFGQAMEDSKKSVEELAKTSSTKQLTAEMVALKEAAEDTRDRLNRGLLGKEDADRQINAVNAALQRLRDAYQGVAAAEKARAEQKPGQGGGGFVGPTIDDKELKRRQKEAEKVRKEDLDATLDAIELAHTKGQLTDQQRIERLKAVAASGKAVGNELRELNEKIAKDEQRLAAETLRKHQEAQRGRQQASLQSLQIQKQAVDSEISVLAQQAAKSAQFDAQLRTAIEKRLQLEIREIQLQGQVAAAATKSSEERLQIEENTRTKIQNARAEAARDKEEPVKQRQEREANETKKKAEDEKKDLGQAESERLQLQRKQIDDEIAALEAKRDKTNANVEQAVIRLIQQKLALRVQELQQETALAQAATESARVKDALQVNLEIKLRNAKREANEEAKKAHQEQLEAAKAATDALNKQTDAIEKQKTALQGGRISSQDEAFAQLSEQFGIEDTRARIEEQRKANQRKPFQSATAPESSPLNPPAPSAAVSQLQADREAARTRGLAEVEAARRNGTFGGPTFAGENLRQFARQVSPAEALAAERQRLEGINLPRRELIAELPQVPNLRAGAPSAGRSAPPSSVTTVTNNVTIRADGHDVPLSGIVRQLVPEVLKAIRGQLKTGALRSGQGAPPGGLGPALDLS